RRHWLRQVPAVVAVGGLDDGMGGDTSLDDERADEPTERLLVVRVSGLSVTAVGLAGAGYIPVDEENFGHLSEVRAASVLASSCGLGGPLRDRCVDGAAIFSRDGVDVRVLVVGGHPSSRQVGAAPDGDEVAGERLHVAVHGAIEGTRLLGTF